MASRFANSTDRLIRTASVLDYNAAYTVTFHLNLVSLRGAFGDFFSINDGSATNYDVLGIDDTNHATVEATPGASVQAAGGVLSTSAWVWAVLRRDSTTSLTMRLYDQTGTVVRTSTSTQNVGGRAASTRMEFNGTAAEGEWFNGDVAGIKIWSTNLSDNELLNERLAYLPRKLDNLVGWWPVLGGEHTRDYSGLGRNWTDGGSPADVSNPPISWGSPLPTVIFSSAAPPSLSLEQEGFGFRNDDGSETTATWRQAQDTNDSVSSATRFRLRFLVNATGDLPAKNFSIRVKKSGDPDSAYRTISVKQ